MESLIVDLLQGSYKELPLTYTGQNVTGANIEFVIKRTPRGTPLFTASTTAGSVVITNGPLGQFKIVFGTAQTSAMTIKEPAILKGQVEITLPGGQTIRTHQMLINYSPEL